MLTKLREGIRSYINTKEALVISENPGLLTKSNKVSMIFIEMPLIQIFKYRYIKRKYHGRLQRKAITFIYMMVEEFYEPFSELNPKEKV